MGVGEMCNFAAYAYASATIVAPLGALSVVVSAVLADRALGERMPPRGWVACGTCAAASAALVGRAPEDAVDRGASMPRVLAYAVMVKPAFVMYAVFAVAAMGGLVMWRGGRERLLAPVATCSLAGSLSVVSVKALGTAMRATFIDEEGENEFAYVETWACVLIVVACVTTQMNYLNVALDRWNTAVVSCVYYVFFTTLCLISSSALYEDYKRQSAEDIVVSMIAFGFICAGVFVLANIKADVAKELATAGAVRSDEELADVASSREE